MFICPYQIDQTDIIGKTHIFVSLWKLIWQMQTHFLILLSEIPVYGVLTHADKQGPNDRQTQFKNHLGLINTRFKCIKIIAQISIQMNHIFR